MKSRSFFYFGLVSLLFLFLLVRESCSNLTFAFVLDSTGSMSGEINAVRTGIKKILNLAPPEITNYAIVPFNDPSVPSALLSNNVTKIRSFLDTITATGGGDCPELAMGGLLRAINLSYPNSILFYFSDASAKDHAKANLVTEAANEKKITIYFLLTGCCGNCFLTWHQAYHSVANSTNGKVYQIQKTTVSTFMDYLFEATAKNIIALHFPPDDFVNATVPPRTTTTPAMVTTPHIDDLLSAQNQALSCQYYSSIMAFPRDVKNREARKSFLTRELESLAKRIKLHVDSIPTLVEEYDSYQKQRTWGPMSPDEVKTGDISKVKLSSQCLFFYMDSESKLFLICFGKHAGWRATVFSLYDGKEVSLTDFPSFPIIRSVVLDSICFPPSSAGGRLHKLSLNYILILSAILCSVIRI